MSPNIGETVSFNVTKNFECIRPLGSGGTGVIYLFKDNTTDTLFAFKKYRSLDPARVDEYYKRFVDEVKILFNLSHPNIVRVYNHYLYPPQKTGYLQMEYVVGQTIDEYDPEFWDEDAWNKIFTETISAFDYLENHDILHRDVRPSNILIGSNSSVKIIDFGFGKLCNLKANEPNSVLLNWPVTEMPDEVEANGEYDQKTEIFFVGKLFDKILKNKNVGDTFRYYHIIERMIQNNPSARFDSFSRILGEISKGIFGWFDNEEKEIYRLFADNLLNAISKFRDDINITTEIPIIMSKLALLLRASSLEEYIQDNSQLIKCFVSGTYFYHNQKNILTDSVKEFYDLIQKSTPLKQKMIFDNLLNRFSLVKVEKTNDMDIPF